MKLQRIYHIVENLPLSLKWLRGDMYDSLYKYEGQGPTTEPTIEQVSFGYSYVADMKARPHEGLRQDYYAAIDIYSVDKHVYGILILQMAYLKEMLTSEIHHNMCYFNGGYKDGEICKHSGRFRVSVNYNNNEMRKYYADIFFDFRGQPFEDSCILCLNKGDIHRLVKAFDKCESELYKLLPPLQTEMNKQ